MADLVAELEKRLEETRQRMARDLGVPVVLTIEGLGYRIVPTWVVESLTRVLRQPTTAAVAAESVPVQSAAKDGSK